MQILRHLSEIPDLSILYAGQVALEELEKIFFLMRHDLIKLPHFFRGKALKKWKDHCRTLLEENELEHICEERVVKNFFLKKRGRGGCGGAKARKEFLEQRQVLIPKALEYGGAAGGTEAVALRAADGDGGLNATGLVELVLAGTSRRRAASCVAELGHSGGGDSGNARAGAVVVGGGKEKVQYNGGRVRGLGEEDDESVPAFQRINGGFRGLALGVWSGVAAMFVIEIMHCRNNVIVWEKTPTAETAASLRVSPQYQFQHQFQHQLSISSASEWYG